MINLGKPLGYFFKTSLIHYLWLHVWGKTNNSITYSVSEYLRVSLWDHLHSYNIFHNFLKESDD